MRSVIISDEHIHPYRECSQDGGADRLADGLGVMGQSLDLAVARNCDWTHLGDLKLTRGIWHQEALSGLLDLFGASRYARVRKRMLPGNGGHDGVGTKETGAGGYDPFRPLAEVIDAPQVDQEVAWWPWCPPHLVADRLPDFLAAARQARVRICCGHAMLLGSKLGPAAVTVDAGLPLTAFGLVGRPEKRVFDWAFFGDVHTGQMLGDPKRRTAAAVYLPGSPYAQNWGERELDKGCLYVDTVKGIVERIPLQAPRFHILDYPATAATRKRAPVQPGDFVRVLTEHAMTEEQEQELRALWRPRFLRVIVVPPARPAHDGTGRRSRAHAAMTREALLDEYLDAFDPPEGVTVAAVRQAGLRLLKGGPL